MKHDYSLAHLTALALPPTDLIDAAAAAGYRYVGLRLTRVTQEEPLYSLITDRALLRETRAHLAGTGVGVWDVELARMGPDADVKGYLPLLQTAAELGARHVISQLPDADRSRAADNFAELCDLAVPFNLGVNLEFVSWTQTPDLHSASAILNAVQRRNAGMLVDLLHFARSNSSVAALRKLPREWFRYAHVCDAPAQVPATVEGLIHTARCERLVPGDGGIDVRGILECLPAGIPYALEIPGDTLAATVGLKEYARLALKAAQNYLDVEEMAQAQGSWQ